MQSALKTQLTPLNGSSKTPIAKMSLKTTITLNFKLFMNLTKHFLFQRIFTFWTQFQLTLLMKLLISQELSFKKRQKEMECFKLFMTGKRTKWFQGFELFTLQFEFLA